MAENTATVPVPEEKSDDTPLIAVDGSLISDARVTHNRTAKVLSKNNEKRLKEGYDSDGGCGPFFTVLMKKEIKSSMNLSFQT